MLNMATSNFFALFHNTNKADFELFLPKIKIQNLYNLNEILNELGLKEAFLINAYFRNLTDFKPVFIHNASQKNFLEIDESGATAVAVTSVKMFTLGKANQKIPRIMKCDRSYLVFLTKY